jgi:hypothetical protein
MIVFSVGTIAPINAGWRIGKVTPLLPFHGVLRHQAMITRAFD